MTTKLTADVAGTHVLIEDPDGHVVRIPLTDLPDLAGQLAGIEPTTPGTRRRDREGDVWTLGVDGLWGLIGSQPRPWPALVERYGPLYPVAVLPWD